VSYSRKLITTERGRLAYKGTDRRPEWLSSMCEKAGVEELGKEEEGGS
jgi:hypothetical protein